MMNAILNWFSDSKGFVYIKPSETYIPISPDMILTDTIGMYPRARKRTSISDIKYFPGILIKSNAVITQKPQPSAIILSEGFYFHFWKVTGGIKLENKCLESLIESFTGQQINDMKTMEMSLADAHLLHGNNNEYTLEQLYCFEKEEVDISTIVINNNINVLKLLTKHPIEETIRNIIFDGYEQSPWEDAFTTDLIVVSELVKSSIFAENIVQIYSNGTTGLNTANLGKVFGALNIDIGSDPIKSNRDLEAISNGLDGLYVNRMTAEGIKSDRISNFTINPMYTVKIDDDEILHCTLYIDGDSNNSVSCKFGKNDLMGWREFLKAIPSSRVQWLAKDKEVQLIRGWINNKKIVSKIGVNQVGYHMDRYVLPTGSIVDGEYIHDDEVVYEDNYNPKVDETDIELEDWANLIKPLLISASKINDPVASQIAMAWFLSCFLAPTFREINGNFPILKVWGTQGSGKTTLVSMLSRILGTDSEPRSCNRTPFTLIRELSFSNCIPAVMDEYKPSEIPMAKLDNLHYLLRLAYNGSLESRGRMNMTVKDYVLTTPVAMSGEMPFTDPALIERSIVLNLSPQYVKSNSHCLEAYNDILSTNTSGALVGYLKWLSDKGGQYWKDFARETLNECREMFQGTGIPLRVIQNMSVIKTGLHIFKELTGMELDDRLIIKNLCLSITSGNITSHMDRFMSHFNDMVIKGAIQYGRDVAVHQGHLYFATDVCIASFSQYCQSHGLRSELTNRESLRQQFIESKQSNGYITEPFGKVFRMPHGRTIRCTVVDLGALETMTSINADSWVIDVTEQIML
jgi:energy-coupling factor transporter ATP-binding protein EcfA2